jgi:hypothetical protein
MESSQSDFKIPSHPCIVEKPQKDEEKNEYSPTNYLFMLMMVGAAYGVFLLTYKCIDWVNTITEVGPKDYKFPDIQDLWIILIITPILVVRY